MKSLHARYLVGKLLLVVLTAAFFTEVPSCAEELHLVVPELRFGNDGMTFRPGKQPYAEVGRFERSRYAGLRARLFWKDEVERRPRWVPANGPNGSDRCYIFASRVLDVSLNTSAIYLRNMPQVKGDWVVVFELGEWSDGPIKLSSGAVDKYFRHKFTFYTETLKERRTFLSRLLGLEFSNGDGLGTVGASSRRGEDEERQLQIATKDAAELARAADDPLCVWFRETTDEKFIIAARRPCRGCASEDPTGGRNSPGWFQRIAKLWLD